MKQISLLLVSSLCLWASFAETVVDVTGTGVQKLPVEIHVAHPAFAASLKKNLELTGLFVVSGKGGIKISGQSGALTAATSSSSVSSSATFSDDKSARMAARQFSDQISEAFGRQKGFATSPILFLKRGRASAANAAIPAELCLAYPDGQDIRQLTSDGKMIIFQRWMKDENKIVYISDLKGATQIWEMDLATNRREVKWSFKGTPTGIAVSPEGARIALILSFQGNPELYVIDLKSNRWERLTNTPYDVEGQPTWSPDGREIAFVRGVNSQQIWVVDVATKKARRLTSKGRKNLDPDWGPDGRIAYLAGAAIAVMDPRGGDSTALTVAEAANWQHPSWARDGRHIVASRDQALFLIDTVEGGDKPRQVFYANGNWVAPSWRK